MLTVELASEIVKRTMAIIDANVNIMDRRGKIIGSGDSRRIGQIHTGAQQVIERQHSVEINPKELAQWSGSQSGINLPIRYQDKVVGVIGITGDPKQIRSYSQLVQMGAELTLEQAFLMQEMQRNQRIREDVIAHLLLSSEKEQDYVRKRAQMLNIDTTASYAVVLVTPHSDDKDEKLSSKIESWLKVILEKEDEFVTLYTNQLVILKRKVPSLDTEEKLHYTVEQKITAAKLNSATVAIGSFRAGVGGWKKSFNDAQMIREVAETLHPGGGVWKHSDLELQMLCYRLWKDSREEAAKIVDHYKRLFVEPDGEELHRTLWAYVHENGKMAKTAEALFIHRNTLSYRLEKIHAVTGRNPKNIEDLIQLKIGQVLYSLST